LKIKGNKFDFISAHKKSPPKKSLEGLAAWWRQVSNLKFFIN